MRLSESEVMQVIMHGIHLKIGRLTLTPIRRASTLPMEFMVDCDHSKYNCSILFKTTKEAAEKFCMLKNVLYANS